MNKVFSFALFPLFLTVLTFQIGTQCQKKLKLSILNPILVAVVLVLAVLKLTGIKIGQYRSGMDVISWLMTPATVCLAIPMYQQLQALRRSIPAILTGVVAGTVASVLMVLGLCALFRFDNVLTISLLPKSVTTAIGVSLSEIFGGAGSVTTAVIVVTGILGNVLGNVFCKIFRITDPIAQGAAFGTAAHVVGTTKANELGVLQGAVSSLSLVTAGVLTAILMPIITALL